VPHSHFGYHGSHISHHKVATKVTLVAKQPSYACNSCMPYVYRMDGNIILYTYGYKILYMTAMHVSNFNSVMFLILSQLVCTIQQCHCIFMGTYVHIYSIHSVLILKLKADNYNIILLCMISRYK